MHTEPATTPQSDSAAGPIRAFTAPVGAGSVEVLAWLEGRELVVKELSSLVRPARGEHRLPIDAIRDIELTPCAEEQLLTLSSEGVTVRLQGAQSVMQSFVRELAQLAQLADIGALEASPVRSGIFGRVVSWLHGQ